MNISFNIAYASLVSLKMQRNILQFEMPEWICPQNILIFLLFHAVQTPSNDMQIRRKNASTKNWLCKPICTPKNLLEHVAVMNRGLLS